MEVDDLELGGVPLLLVDEVNPNGESSVLDLDPFPVSAPIPIPIEPGCLDSETEDIITMTPLPVEEEEDEEGEEEEEEEEGIFEFEPLASLLATDDHGSDSESESMADDDSSSGSSSESDNDDNVGKEVMNVLDEEEEEDNGEDIELSVQQKEGFRNVTTKFLGGRITIQDFALKVLEEIGVGEEQTPEDLADQLPSLSSSANQSLAEMTRPQSFHGLPLEYALTETEGFVPGSPARSPCSSPLPGSSETTPVPGSPLPPFSILDLLGPQEGRRSTPTSPKIHPNKKLLGSPMATPATPPTSPSLIQTRSQTSRDSTVDEVTENPNADLMEALKNVPGHMLVDSTGKGYTDIRETRKLFPRPGFYGTGNSPAVFTLQRKRKLPTTFQNLIGEAHVQFARGNQKHAVEICMEIIKEQPMCAEPFNTLALIYENDNKPKETFQFALIAAVLNPRGCADWPKLAEMSAGYKMTTVAQMCLTKALVVEPLNADLHLKRCALLEAKGDFRGALRGYSKVLQLFPDRGELCVQVLRRSAKIYHKNATQERAYDCLKDAMINFPKYITSTESNLMLELCVSMKKYVEACQILMKYSAVQFIPEFDEECFASRESLTAALKFGKVTCVPPTSFNADLMAKLIIVLVHLEAYTITDKLSFEMIRERDVEKFGDLYLEIAEAYMAKRKYVFPLNFLQPLIDSENFSLAAIWLRYAECLFLLNRYEEAAVAYKRVVVLAPTHNLAKLNLSIILQKLGRTQDALETLNQDKGEDAIDHELLIEKCNILWKRKRTVDFMESVLLLLSRFCVTVRTKDEAFLIALVTHFSKRAEGIQRERAKRGVDPEDDKPVFLDKHTKVEKEWKLYLRLSRMLASMERWDLLSRVAYTACTSDLFAQFAHMEKEVESHCFLSSLMIGDEDLLPHHMRLFLGRHSDKQLVLNLFSLAIQICDHSRYTKHILRLLEKYPADYRLMLLNAHLSFATGTYKNALMEYSTLFALTPKDPLVPLMLSITLLHVMTQKTSLCRLPLGVNIIAFMKKYMELRGPCQEAYYNMARTLHFMGMQAMAIEYYQLVLKTPPVRHNTSGIKKMFYNDDDALDLKYEAAFNLAHIYRQNGANELARETIINYIVI